MLSFDRLILAFDRSLLWYLYSIESDFGSFHFCLAFGLCRQQTANGLTKGSMRRTALLPKIWLMYMFKCYVQLWGNGQSICIWIYIILWKYLVWKPLAIWYMIYFDSNFEGLLESSGFCLLGSFASHNSSIWVVIVYHFLWALCHQHRALGKLWHSH